MIEFGNIKEKELLIHYADEFDNSELKRIVESGVNSKKEVEKLARFYWKIVDETVDNKDIENLLEKVYITLYIHCSNRGYSDTWDSEVP